MGGLFFWCKLLHPPVQAEAVAFDTYTQTGSGLVPARFNSAAEVWWEPVDCSAIVSLIQEAH